MSEHAIRPAVGAFAASVRETHIGVVVLIGDRAFKIKKAVRTPFLDFSTPDKRLAACRRELELNRRLAPDVYLGLAHLSCEGPAPDTAGNDLTEHILVMRRMPDDRRLAALVRAGHDVRADLRALAKLLAQFHARAKRGPLIDAEGTQEALRRRWTTNLAELRELPDRPIDDATLDMVASTALDFVAGREPLLTERIRTGRVLDGHGDLLAEDIFCLPDGPRALDCLEFDDRLRYLDELDDVACLAMDLERLGRPDLARSWLADYAEFSGDPAPESLRHHYVAYRALVRAKVGCLRHAQGDPGAAEQAVRHAGLAADHLVTGAVRLALVGGLPGSGKTTLAGGLADRFGAVVLSSDRIRKELAGLDPTASASAGYQRGLYAPDRTEAVYSELLRRAECLLGRGESVVIDASWTSAHHRRAAEELARRSHSILVPLRCWANTEIAHRRILTRAPTPSDATVPVAAAMERAADPWPEAVGIPTAGSVAASLDLAAAAWREAR